MARAESPVTEGSWSTLPYPMPINPIHVGLLHTGKVLVVAGSENIGSQHEDEEYYGAVWDPASGTITVQNLLWDIFCTGMSAMPDGRYLIVGATSSYNPFYGDSLASVFDPVTEKFAQAEYMAHGRWYATSTVLADGSTMAFSGLTELNQINMAVELYNVGSGWSPEYIAPWKPPLYPRMHLLPDGTVFYSGPTSISSIFNPSHQGLDRRRGRDDQENESQRWLLRPPRTPALRWLRRQVNGRGRRQPRESDRGIDRSLGRNAGLA